MYVGLHCAIVIPGWSCWCCIFSNSQTETLSESITSVGDYPLMSEFNLFVNVTALALITRNEVKIRGHECQSLTQ